MIHGNPRPSASVVGVCPVVETPFDLSEESDPGALSALVARLGAVGVTSIMYAGLASETHKLADAERDELTQVVIAEGRAQGMTVVASVSDASTITAARRAALYAACGADVINVLAPTEVEPGGPPIANHAAAVLAAVGPTPAILQVLPAHVNAGLGVASIAALAESSPNLVQVKVEMHPPAPFIAELQRDAPRLTCLVGRAGVDLPSAVRAGAVGVQPGCSAPELYMTMWRLWSSGDPVAADRLHARLHPFLVYWMQDVELIVAAEKRISFLRGLTPTDVCRSPARTLTSEELSMVDRFLEEFSAELG